MLGKRQLPVLKLIENKYLSREFWERGRPAEAKIKKQLKKAMLAYGERNRLPILQALFERLYIMRLQVFHGASTKGSKLNRRTLQGSAGIMMDLLPEIIGIMLEFGVEEDWGGVCFPPSD